MDLVIEARVREYLKRQGMQVQASFIRNLDKLVRLMLDDAVSRARLEHRKRVLVRDLPFQELMERAQPDRFYPTRSYIPMRPGGGVMVNRRGIEPSSSGEGA